MPALILPQLQLCGILLSVVDLPDVPAHAIAAFERLSGLAVCLHDPGRLLWSYLPPDRFEHLNALCRAVKTVRLTECLSFESKPLYEEAAAPARWRGEGLPCRLCRMDGPDGEGSAGAMGAFRRRAPTCCSLEELLRRSFADGAWRAVGGTAG